MADVKSQSQTSPSHGNAAPTPSTSNSVHNRGPSIHQIYALPAPIRTLPLPTFCPNNPLSLVHVLTAWLSQVISPPAAEPAVIHQGVWSEATTSIHVTDAKSMRALWEQGFYGKGSLSRSEPNWLKREQVRRGLHEDHVSEILTLERRQARAQAKWERARVEQEAIRSTRLEEARQAQACRQAANSLPARPALVAPVGPLELLTLPNSHADLSAILQTAASLPKQSVVTDGIPNGLLITPHMALDEQAAGVDASWRSLASGGEPLLIDRAEGHDLVEDDDLDTARPNRQGPNGSAWKPTGPSDASSDCIEETPQRRRKSVRFSPRVESTTFELSDPPSPNHSSTAGKTGQLFASSSGGVGKNYDVAATPWAADAEGSEPATTPTQPLVNKEHLQLMPEEAFFLSFGFGVLRVSDPLSGKWLSTGDLLTRFRQYSYFPPRIGPEEADLEPDDGFLVHYAVYHHFRSLGWVPRAGVKFGVDWLLYTRGPVFDHAEFGLMVMASYSDPWWKASGKEMARKTWPWLHSVVRVLSHVTKSLVLVYVDVPPPPRLEQALKEGVAEALRLYKIREVVVKRWSSNRSR